MFSKDDLTKKLRMYSGAELCRTTMSELVLDDAGKSFNSIMPGFDNGYRVGLLKAEGTFCRVCAEGKFMDGEASCVYAAKCNKLERFKRLLHDKRGIPINP